MLEPSHRVQEYAAELSMSVTELDNNGWTLLHHAAERSAHQHSAQLVKDIVEVMPQWMLNVCTSGGTPKNWTALAMMCTGEAEGSDRSLYIGYLLAGQADPNVRNRTNATALITAAGAGMMAAVQALWADPRTQHDAENVRGKNAADVVPKFHTDLHEFFKAKGLAPTGAVGSSRCVKDK